MIAHKVSTHFIKSHRSPLHYLFFTTGIKPHYVETITSTRCHPSYHPTMCTIISYDKDEALGFTKIVHETTKYKVYTDGSGYEGGTGAMAVLYKNDRIIRSLQLHLGTNTEHTVYKSELIGNLLALHLLTSLKCHLLSTVIVGLDNQATICSLNNQKHKPAHHLFDLIHRFHTAAKCLYSCQDHIQQCTEIQNSRHCGQNPRIKTRNVCDLCIHWVQGHLNFKPNNKADKLAKKAAKGESSHPADLPAYLPAYL